MPEGPRGQIRPSDVVFPVGRRQDDRRRAHSNTTRSKAANRGGSRCSTTSTIAAASISAVRTASRLRVAAQHSQDYSVLVFAHSRAESDRALDRRADAKGLLKAAIRDPNPVMFLENEILYGHSSPVPKFDDYVLPIGRAPMVRPGNDVTIVAWSMGMTYRRRAGQRPPAA